MKKILSFCLCLLMIFNITPIKTFGSEEWSIEEIIRPQMEAFAKSIDQKNADGKAQDALISHGMFGGGKKLSVGKSSALTATIMNSELAKEYLTVICADLIKSVYDLEMEKIYTLGLISWRISGDRYYFYNFYDYNSSESFLNGKFSFPEDKFKYSGNYTYTTKSNSYDNSLELIAGGLHADIDIKIKERNESNIVYDFSVRFFDRFDFDTDNSSALEDLLGFIGMLLFEPFEWESKFNFQIEIPIEKPEENIIFGDFDGSGSVDVADAYFARLVSAKLVVPTEEQIALCDVDLDGRITAMDANIIRKYALGIIKELPVK
ncbi:MAG: hypothetical protein E7479_01910 [Ruminococcaceae bacterium]|nr:hypothetical protein [Oscillospiraceae bacterium]